MHYPLLAGLAELSYLVTIAPPQDGRDSGASGRAAARAAERVCCSSFRTQLRGAHHEAEAARPAGGEGQSKQNNVVSHAWGQVMHTTDGKQFVTEQQLEQEIQDEATVRGGA
jgi:hypothetical protein